MLMAWHGLSQCMLYVEGMLTRLHYSAAVISFLLDTPEHAPALTVLGTYALQYSAAVGRQA
jgi:hypothetical protein